MQCLALALSALNAPSAPTAAGSGARADARADAEAEERRGEAHVNGALVAASAQRRVVGANGADDGGGEAGEELAGQARRNIARWIA